MKKNKGLVLFSVCLLTGLVVGVAACGKQVNIKSSLPVPSIQPSALTCPSGQVKQWVFKQPDVSVSGSVDILFVVDTSASLDEERSKIASTLPEFVDKLSPQVDYQIGIMLAHGPGSYWSGRLYSASNSPRVLSSKNLSALEIQTHLKRSLLRLPNDVDEANGEMLLASLTKGLQTTRLSEARKQGFFRDQAALSVLFVTDENDGCYLPDQHGYSSAPDFVPSEGNYENIAYKRYCVPPGAKSEITPESVLSGLRALKGTAPLSVAGVIHPAQPEVKLSGEDAVGHGILELVQGTLNGSIIPILQSSYSNDIAKLGNKVTSQLSLRTLFHLDGPGQIRKESMQVRVDNKSARFQFDSNQNLVEIAVADAGQAKSEVTVAACVTQ